MKHSFGRSALVAALALVAIVLAPMAFADVPPRHLTVATFNIKHGAGTDDVLDLERTAGVVEKSGADVIGLQEVDKHWSDRSDFADQAAWLACRLGMHVAYGANLDLDPANPGEPRRQYGTAILSRFPILDSRNTLLPRAPQGEQRGLLEARINVRGKKMLFLNTHLQHTSQAERSAQVEAINGIVAGRNLPAVLTGDLNATPDAPEIAEITEHLVDTWPIAGRGDGFTFDAAAPKVRIDYVLASPEIDVHRAEVISTTASDHLPVVVDIALR
ncbi:Metal-dependent hydrolase, endonuclease/exonuclease/phosphatase family [Saccharopolyspora antimicrobica]|uniref:Endonuclease/exonuclease/phosphatase family metal-dependent hydrolase n=1 Tax=Saccharopolyspora antimicrobica TaxID=455193 RepID=A0A1I5HE83_9PSEU|nr:endonuclease/exonuclease/phosphatase family protein [Saccharopolyspora antimicrobica]RKT85343.1 endonuclease/exonuclease/phosphatase family metal-dependent hydrolase [Saccharopolyspora antimicrobica]SFO46572.1 Metal-dependent hydrolase, endonuclease/exonuclease/phosphatase family [Saccharopolyspora antimicrobica]